VQRSERKVNAAAATCRAVEACKVSRTQDRDNEKSADKTVEKESGLLKSRVAKPEKC
jgi:hypothetical protein